MLHYLKQSKVSDESISVHMCYCYWSFNHKVVIKPLGVTWH